MPSASAPVAARRTPLTRAHSFDTITDAAHAPDLPDIGSAPHMKPAPVQPQALLAMPMPVRAAPSAVAIQRRASASEAMTSQATASHALSTLGDGWHLHDRIAAQGAALQQAQPAPEAEPHAPAPDLDDLVERTWTRLLDRLAVEQERRGVTRWL